jgi:serine/threonine-protein kinase
MASARPQERRIGRYTICEPIAAGGMAKVCFGRLTGPAGFSRVVAVKSLHAELAVAPEVVAMLLDEARLVARIRHPNVVATLDVLSEDGDIFVVMEYVHGETLSSLVRAARRRDERVPVRIATAIMAGVLDGLHAAHELRAADGDSLGIVHRDVSPQNVLVGTDGLARVLDFGIAKARGRLQTTREGQVKGKLPYMAPEQVRGEAIDRRCDIFAAGAVLWEALTGERLFQAEDEGALLMQVLTADVPPPSRLRADVPPALDAIVARALASDAARRHPNTCALAIELEEQVGIATPREVGAWVERLCGATLAARADRVSALEREAPTAVVAKGTIASDDTVGDETEPDALADEPVRAADLAPPRPRRSSRTAAVAASITVTVVAVVAVAASVSSRSATNANASASVVTPSELEPAPSTSAVAAVSAPDLAPSSPPPANGSADAAAARRLPRAAPRQTPTCSPPYTVDASGIRHWKAGCK